MGFDSLPIGFYRNGQFRYCASTRNGFVPATRREVFGRIRGLQTDVNPFISLPEAHPEAHAGRGELVTAKKISEYRWVRPEVIAQLHQGFADGEMCL